MEFVNHYFPGFNFGPIITMLMVNVAILGPRLGKPRKIIDVTTDTEESTLEAE